MVESRGEEMGCRGEGVGREPEVTEGWELLGGVRTRDPGGFGGGFGGVCNVEGGRLGRVGTRGGAGEEDAASSSRSLRRIWIAFLVYSFPPAVLWTLCIYL